MRKNSKEVFKTVLSEQRVAGGLGSIASKITPELELRRAVLACMLWEDIAYETGVSVADHIGELVAKVSPEVVAKIAIQARTEQNLRHVPLLLCYKMAGLPSHKHLVASTLESVIQRPDEMMEFVALYWKDGKKPLSNQIKKGLAASFKKFNEYQLAKYKGASNNAIKLRDVLFLTHPKASSEVHKILWNKLANDTLAAPDTWEVAISAKPESKKETWTRLLEEKKLGSLALLRNLRNMKNAEVDVRLISQSLLDCKTDKVLPFRFISAWKEMPDFKNELQTLMLKTLSNTQAKIAGKTVVIVDVSGSMMAAMSGRSTSSRLDAAAALVALIKGVSEDCTVYATAGDDYKRIAKSKRLGKDKEGFDLIAAINDAYQILGGGGIFLKQCVDYAKAEQQTADTLIVISDSQDTSGDESPKLVVPFGKFNYMMDISCHKHGVAYEKFTVLNGFSEALVDYVVQDQKLQTAQ